MMRCKKSESRKLFAAIYMLTFYKQKVYSESSLYNVHAYVY